MIVLAAALSLVVTCQVQDPGRRIHVSALVDRLAKSKTAGAAERELVQLGEKAVPLLIRDLAEKTRGEAGHLRRRERVLAVVRQMRGVAPRVVADIVDAIPKAKDPYLLQAHALVLQELGPYAPDELGAARSTLDQHVERLFVSNAPEWLVDTTNNRLATGLRAQARLRVDPRASTRALIGMLRHDDPFHREAAAILLGERKDRAALDELREMLLLSHPSRVYAGKLIVQVDGDAIVRSAAAVAISRIAPEDPDAADGHLIRLAHPVHRERITAALALGHLGSGEKKVIDALSRGAMFADPRVQAECIAALASLGPKAGPAYLVLDRIARGKDEHLAKLAKQAIQRVRGK